MGAKSFEELRVWQEARKLSDLVGRLLQSGGFGRDYVMQDQLNAAVVSTANNIAEGFRRRTSRDFAHFVRIAASSNAEVASLIQVAEGRHYVSSIDRDHVLLSTASIDRMLRALEKALRGNGPAGRYPSSYGPKVRRS
jgi:four helix bundle protein